MCARYAPTIAHRQVERCETHAMDRTRRSTLCRDTVVWVPLGDVLWPARILARLPGSRWCLGDPDLRCVEAFEHTQKRLHFVHVSRLHEYVSRSDSYLGMDSVQGRAAAREAADRFILAYGTSEQREALRASRNQVARPTLMRLRIRPDPVRITLPLERAACMMDGRGVKRRCYDLLDNRYGEDERPVKLRRCDSTGDAETNVGWPVRLKRTDVVCDSSTMIDTLKKQNVCDLVGNTNSDVETPVKLVLRIRKPREIAKDRKCPQWWMRSKGGALARLLW